MNNNNITGWSEEQWIEYVSRNGIDILNLQLEASRKRLSIEIACLREARGTDEYEEAREYFSAYIYMQRIYKKAIERLAD